MITLPVYNLKGEKVEDLEVADSVFGLAINADMIQQVAVAISANQRVAIAHAKTRGERAGSGIKPWKQKGTGRARVGSVRTPLWKKGGVVFGPRSDRNFTKKVNQKTNSKAIAMVLSGKVKDGELKIVNEFEMTEKKTKVMAAAIKTLGLKGKILVAYSNKEKDMRLMSRNIEKVENTLTSQLNVLDMLKNKNLLMSKESVKYLEEKYNKAK